MAINKKFIVFKTKENFNKELEAGNILPSSWVVIKDTQEIYVKETYIKGFDISKVEEIIDSKLEDYLTESEIKELLKEIDLSNYPTFDDVVTNEKNGLITPTDKAKLNSINTSTLLGPDLYDCVQRAFKYDEGVLCRPETGKFNTYITKDYFNISFGSLQNVGGWEGGKEATATITSATTTKAGVMSAEDKIKLDSLNEWFGTQDEYDALGTYNDETKYYILED